MNRRNERGSIAPAIPVIAFALLLLGGLGIDASRQLNARGQALAFAEEAARAGAQAVDTSDDLTDDGLKLDRREVAVRVQNYCDAVLDRGAVDACRLVRIERDPETGEDLVVVTEVRMVVPATLLGMVGVREMRASATAKARPFAGIDTPFL